jgi:putative endonuclease
VNYWLYILYSERVDRYYVGISRNVAQRLHYHNTAPKGWTIRGRPWRLMYSRKFADRITAQRSERFLKAQKSREVIERVVDGLQDVF